MKKKFIASLLSTTLLITSSLCVFADTIKPDSSTDELIPIQLNDEGLPLADGIDIYADENADLRFQMADGIDIGGEEGIETYSTNATKIRRQSYKSDGGFTTGLFVGGSTKPTAFKMDKTGYAQFSSVYQEPVNSGDTVEIVYQVLGYNTNDVFSGKRLSGVQSIATVTLTSNVQGGEVVSAYLRNYTGHSTKAEGYFNWKEEV